MDDFDATGQHDGILRYRRDPDGTHVGIIPSTCKACRGPLHAVGFRARQHDGVMVVDCDRCLNLGLPGHAWQFIAPKAAPDRIELDYSPYVPGTPPC